LRLCALQPNILLNRRYGSISAANFFERSGGSCFNTGRQGTKLLIFTVAYLRLINWQSQPLVNVPTAAPQ
jgi:hypothetical protein